MNDDGIELPIRDPAAAILAVGGNTGLARELFAAFLESLEPQLQEIRQRHRASDWAELRNSAHRLHGSAAYCGVPAMKAEVRALEQAAREGESAEIDRRMHSLEREIGRLFANTKEDV